MAKYKLGQQVFIVKAVEIQKAAISEIRINNSGTSYYATDPLNTTELTEANVLEDKRALKKYFDDLLATILDL